MNTPDQPKTNGRDIALRCLCAREMCQAFGISAKTLQEWVADGRMPMPSRTLSSPRKFRWSVADLDAWEDAGCPSNGKWQRIKEERIRKRGTIT